ncbi:MAG: UTRA domain-containing protein, partial [Actinomycetota bacterium]
PRDVVAGTDLETPRLLTEGTYLVLDRIGHPPVRCSEELVARMPTPAESELLRLRLNVPVMSVVRITRGAGGRVLQALRIVAAGDRNVFVYNDLPIPQSHRS